MRSSEEESTGSVIRDRRRIDPVTGQVRGTGQPVAPRGAGSPLRGGPGQPRPGKHAASKPGGTAGAAGTALYEQAQAAQPSAGAEQGPQDAPPNDDVVDAEIVDDGKN